MLPEYCKYTQLFRTHVPGGDNPAEIARWDARMGSAFQSMHHYCWGLMKTNRAMLLAKTRQDREFYLGSSIGEFDYVLERAQPGFVLLPEIYTRKGENLIRLGRSGPAIEALEKAIALKADYWPPYAHLSDFYKSKGDAARAREILENGLALVPDAKALRRRLAELKTAGARR
jgi:tetratricopeptide (TPR) repeat protein